MSRYTINDIQMPGVTSITGQQDKSEAMKPWAVKVVIEYIKNNITFDYYPVRGHVVEKENLFKIIDKSKFKYKNVSEKAKDIGSITHDLIEQYIKAKIAGFNCDPTKFNGYCDEVENAFLAFLQWEKENIDSYLESEQPVCSLYYMYAGTLDIIAKMKNGLIYVIDLKTSSGFYDGMAKQIAAYKFARMEKKPNDQFECEFKSDNGNWKKTISQKPLYIDGMGVLRLDKKTGEPEFKDYTKDYDHKLNAFIHLLDFYYADKKRQLKNNIRSKSRGKEYGNL